MNDYGWIDLGNGRQVFRRLSFDVPARSELPMPMVISDHMDAAIHPCTGTLMDSKSRFSKVTRDHGCIEVGNDPARLRPKPKAAPDRKAIRETLLKAKARVG